MLWSSTQFSIPLHSRAGYSASCAVTSSWPLVCVCVVSMHAAGPLCEGTSFDSVQLMLLLSLLLIYFSVLERLGERAVVLGGTAEPSVPTYLPLIYFSVLERLGERAVVLGSAAEPSVPTCFGRPRMLMHVVWSGFLGHWPFCAGQPQRSGSWL